MNIGQAAKTSGVSAKMIRYYEGIRLIPPPARRQSGYRDYDQSDVQRLRFVRRSRELGFPMERIRVLLALWSDRTKDNVEVRRVARAHILELEEQAAKLRSMIATLDHLLRSCRGENRQNCPIIGDLSGGVVHDDSPPVGRHTRRLQP